MPINYNTQIQPTNPYISGDSNALVSDSTTGNVSGGSYNQRRVANGKKAINGSAIMGGALALGSTALDAIDDDPGYGNVDILKSATKYAAAGAAAGPWGAAAGFVVGGVVGKIEKNKFDKAEKETKKKELDDLNTKSLVEARMLEDQSFNEGMAGAKLGAYGVSDIDNFIKKNNG